MTRATPNDPKLSDGGGWRDGCAGEGGGAASVTAGAVRCSAWLGVAVIWKLVEASAWVHAGGAKPLDAGLVKDTLGAPPNCMTAPAKIAGLKLSVGLGLGADERCGDNGGCLGCVLDRVVKMRTARLTRRGVQDTLGKMRRLGSEKLPRSDDTQASRAMETHNAVCGWVTCGFHSQ